MVIFYRRDDQMSRLRHRRLRHLRVLRQVRLRRHNWNRKARLQNGNVGKVQCDQMLEEKVAIAQNVTKGALNQKVMFFILANEVTKYLGYFC